MVQSFTYSLISMQIGRTFSLLVYCSRGMVIGRSRCVIVYSLGSMLPYSLFCMVVYCLFDVVMCLVGRMMVLSSMCRHHLMFLLLRSVYYVDSRGILMTWACFTTRCRRWSTHTWYHFCIELRL